MDSIERKYRGQYIRRVLDELYDQQQEACANAMDEGPYRSMLERIRVAIQYLNDLVGKRTAR